MSSTRETRPARDGEGGNAVKGNGGDENPGAITGSAPLSGKRPDGSVREPLREPLRETIRANSLRAPEDNGDREAIPAAKLDKVYTADSKERWGADQPSHADQLAASAKADAQIAKDEAKNR